MSRLHPGNEIMVLRAGKPLRVRVAGQAAGHITWYGYVAALQYGTGRVALDQEGVLWARGWNTPEARMIEAQHLLLVD